MLMQISMSHTYNVIRWFLLLRCGRGCWFDGAVAIVNGVVAVAVAVAGLLVVEDIKGLNALKKK